FISANEMDQAKADYQHAREVYAKRLEECQWD
ncbi:MAG: hypothetical protein ACI9R3_006304, partial [Verrucomicrobiales bacterium]